MLGTSDALDDLVRGPGKRHTIAVAIAVALSLGALATDAQAPAISPTGSMGGLEAKFIDVGGVNTRYFEMGQGETIVLLHGGGSWSAHSSANTWVRNIPGLAKQFHVLAPDRLGTGMTGAPLADKDFNIQGELEHLFRFLQAKNVTRVHIVGQSMGGMAAFHFTVAHPEMVRTMIIVNSASLVPVAVAETNRPGMLAAQCPDAKVDDYGEWRCRLRLLSANPDRAFDEHYFEVHRAMMDRPEAKAILAKIAAGAGEPLRSQSGQLKEKNLQYAREKGFGSLPVLLYWDKSDPSAILKGSTQVVDMKGALELYDLIGAKTPNVRMLISQGGGHFPYRTHPEEFNREIVDFIDFWKR